MALVTATAAPWLLSRHQFSERGHPHKFIAQKVATSTRARRRRSANFLGNPSKRRSGERAGLLVSAGLGERFDRTGIADFLKRLDCVPARLLAGASQGGDKVSHGASTDLGQRVGGVFARIIP